MSLWEFTAAVGGWIKVNTAKPENLNREEAAGLGDLLDSLN